MERPRPWVWAWKSKARCIAPRCNLLSAAERPRLSLSLRTREAFAEAFAATTSRGLNSSKVPYLWSWITSVSAHYDRTERERIESPCFWVLIRESRNYIPQPSYSPTPQNFSSCNVTMYNAPFQQNMSA